MTVNSVAGEDTCSENELSSSKGTYTSTKVTSIKASSTHTPTTSQSGFRRNEYNAQPRQSWYRNSNPLSRYGYRSRSNRSGWQSSSYGSYQPWIGSNLAKGEAATPAYIEEIATEEAQMYQPHSASTQEIDPEITLERMCSWLGNILRKSDLARKLTGARLELGVDSDGNNKATFWLMGDNPDPRSFSLEDKSLIKMAFSTEVRRGYQLQLASGQVVVPIR